MHAMEVIEGIMFSKVCASLVASDAKSAWKIIDDKTVLRATWRFKPKVRDKRREMVVTFGAPNYRESKFIKRCKLAHDAMSPREIQYRPFPKKAK